MYGRFAEIYDALYAYKDYQAECEKVQSLIRENCPSAETLLDVGCGTGAHLVFLANDFDCVGVDFSEEQLAGARTKLPNVQFHKADMREFDLGRKFDAVVCLFSTIGYCQSLEELHQTARCLAKHLTPAGVLLVEPWFSKDSFKPGTFHVMTGETPELKIARGNTSRVEGDISILELAFLLVNANGIEYFTESHRLGLFSQEDYRSAFEGAGLEVNFNERGLIGRGLYLARTAGG